MGVKRQQEWSSTCNVVLIGDGRVGKTALVNRALADKFSESYIKTSSSGERIEWNFTVAGRGIHYSIVDLGGSKSTNATPSSNSVSKSTSTLSLHHSGSLKSSGIYREADVFLLCYRISDPASLFSAVNFWCPEIRISAPTTPIILVGCQSDLRGDRDILATLARRGQAPVSPDQGLTLSQQSGCVLYIETSSKLNPRSAVSAFEVAALAKFGHLTMHHKARPSNNMSMSLMSLTGPNKFMPPPVPPKPTLQSSIPTMQRVSPPIPPKPRRAVSTIALNVGPHSGTMFENKENNLNKSVFVSQHHLDQPQSKISNFGVHRPVSASRSHLLQSSPRLSFKTSRERSMSSLLSLNQGHGQRTPKMARKNSEKTVTIKCQRLNAEKQFEEVDVEVPAPIYETLRFYNCESSASSGVDTTSSRGSRGSGYALEGSLNAKTRTLTSKIKSLFGRT